MKSPPRSAHIPIFFREIDAFSKPLVRREKYFWLLQIAKEGRILRVVISLLAVVFVIALSSLVIEWRVESYVKGYAYSLCNMATTCMRRWI
jgi:hypothetical protein